MNIVFTIKTHNLEKAAAVEKALKELDIKFDIEAETNGASPTTRRKVGKLTRIDIAAIALVKQAIQLHPTWSYVDIGKHTGVNDQAVGKIARNKHPLQQTKLDKAVAVL